MERGWEEARSHAVFSPLPLAPSRLGEGGEKKPTPERGEGAEAKSCHMRLIRHSLENHLGKRLSWRHERQTLFIWRHEFDEVWMPMRERPP